MGVIGGKKAFRRVDVRQRIIRLSFVLIAVIILVLLYVFLVPLWWDVEDGKEVLPTPPVPHPVINCSEPRRSFEPLREFSFWGKVMNVSWPCPTSGMNNQLMMMMGKIFCLSEMEAKRAAVVSANTVNGIGIGSHTHAPSVSVFKWKDITCSPTGGKEGRKHYAVGGEDYIYMWFRWSELMQFSQVRLWANATTVTAIGYSGVTPLLPTANGNTEQQLKEKEKEEEEEESRGVTHVTHLCLSDVYSWSEQRWLESCPASVDGIWGTAVYWDMRYALRLHTWFEQTAVEFLQRHGVSRSPSQSNLHAVIGLHVRRGDYEKFCRENARGRGRRKYRVPPFVYLRRWKHPNNTILGSHFWEACYPTLNQIVTTIASVTAIHTHIRTVMLMTNSASFRHALRDALRERKDTQHLNLLSFVAASPDRNRATTITTTSNNNNNNNNNTAVSGEVPPVYWGRSATYYTTAEAAWMDITLISLAEVMILNRYSTFSHSAVDVHILREKRLAAKLLWW